MLIFQHSSQMVKDMGSKQHLRLLRHGTRLILLYLDMKMRLLTYHLPIIKTKMTFRPPRNHNQKQSWHSDSFENFRVIKVAPLGIVCPSGALRTRSSSAIIHAL